MSDTALWAPTAEAVAQAPMTAFMRAASKKAESDFRDYADLHRWSVEAPEAFWELVWNFCGVIGDRGERTLSNGEKMPGAAFFPDACINFAENLLRKTGFGDALVFRGDDKAERRLSWDELHALVSRFQQLFRSLGVKPGDRIAAMMPNMPETVAAPFGRPVRRISGSRACLTASARSSRWSSSRRMDTGTTERQLRLRARSVPSSPNCQAFARR